MSETLLICKRADKRSPEVIDQIISDLEPELIKWADQIEKMNEYDKESLHMSLVTVLKFAYTTDAFQLAKKFEEEYGLEGDEALVDVFSSYWSLQRNAIAKANEKWVKLNDLKGPEIDKTVKITGNTQGYKGKIGVVTENKKDGQSLVCIESEGHVRSGTSGNKTCTMGTYINWEDLELVNE